MAPQVPETSRSSPSKEDPSAATATFGPFPSNQNLSVHVKADNLNIHPSSLSALERIAEKSPEIASQLIRASEGAVKADSSKYKTSAICAAAVALGIVVGSATVIIAAGVGAGLSFFLACVVACSVVTVMLTGKSQDISWTVKLFNKSQNSSPADDGVANE